MAKRTGGGTPASTRATIFVSISPGRSQPFPDSAIRNGAKAVGLAERALQVSGGSKPRVHQVMAAAYAEQSQFDGAPTAAERGVEVARNQGNNAIGEALQANANLYRTRQPLRTGLR